MASPFVLGASMVQPVVWLATDLNHLISNLGVVMSKWGFIFHFASLPLEATRPI